MSRLKWQDDNNGLVYYYPNEEEATHRIRIQPDNDPLNPRTEYDNVCTVLCWHSWYKLGDSFDSTVSRHVSYPDYYKDLEELENTLKGAGGAVIRPLYLYDHSGLTISMSPFSCPWDSGQIGWIYCSFEQANKHLLTKPLKNPHRSKSLHQKILACMAAEVECYDQYLRGDVWGYVIEENTPWDDGTLHDDWYEIEGGSCCDRYGLDFCKQEAVDVLLRHIINTHKQPDGTFADIA